MRVKTMVAIVSLLAVTGICTTLQESVRKEAAQEAAQQAMMVSASNGTVHSVARSLRWSDHVGIADTDDVSVVSRPGDPDYQFVQGLRRGDGYRLVYSSRPRPSAPADEPWFHWMAAPAIQHP